MKSSARHAKIVEWSAEDHCYVGSAPGLILGGRHGDDEQAVFEELCQIVEETVALYERNGSRCRRPRGGVISRAECRASPNRQLQRTVMDKVPRHIGQRAAAELRR